MRGIVAVFFGLVVCVNAQETRSIISGTVLDQQGTAISGASVTVTNLDTNTTTPLTTNDTGYYEASLLLPGTYKISAKMDGFKTAVRTGVSLVIGGQADINLTLEIGEVSQSVTVSAEAPVLETSAFTSGAVIDNKMLMDLPNMGNNPTLLAKFVPGMQTDGVDNYLGLHSVSGGSDYYVGGKVGGNDWSIDGVPNNGGSRRAAYLPYSDTIQEFRVETSGFDASIGRGTGASITAITKSGNNRYNGTITEQHWQQRLNATPFFTKQLYYRNISAAEAAGDHARAEQLRSEPKQPSGHSNNYAATIGGPVVLPKLYNGKNKLFFFFSYNGFKDIKTEDPNSINRTIPTMAQRQGDFSQLLQVDPVRYQLYDPLTGRRDPDRTGNFTIRDPLPGNILPQSRIINPVYKTYVKFLPVPNNDPIDPRKEPLVNYLAVGTPYNWDYWALSSRVDYNMSTRHRFFGRWSYNRFLEDRSDWTYESARGLHSNGLQRRNRGATLDYTWAKSSSMLIGASGSVNEYREGSFRPVQMSYTPSSVGLPAYMDQWAGDQHILPYMSFSGYTSLSSSGVPTFTSFRTLSGRADVSIIRGAHTWRLGTDTRHHFRTGGGGGNTSGNFSFNNQWTKKYNDNLVTPGSLGHSWAAFMMGLPNSMSIATNNENYAMHSPYYGLYGQNSWRLLRKLTLNLGMRLEYEGGPTERYNRMIGWFDPNLDLLISQDAKAAYAANAQDWLPAEAFNVRGGTVFPGVDGTPREAYKGEWMWMPRASVVWQIARKFVIRGGYGLYFDTLNTLNQTPNQTGFARSTSTSLSSNNGQTWLVGDPANGISPLTDPFPIRADGTRFNTPKKGAAGPLSLAGRGFTYQDYDTHRTRQHKWRAGAQYEIVRNTRVEVNYAGSYADRVYVTKDMSPLPEQYWADGLERRNDISSFATGSITNPFRLSTVFPDLQKTNPVVWEELNSTDLFRNSTIQRQQMLRPFPHMTSLDRGLAPLGIVKTHNIEASAVRRFAGGAQFTFGYTRLWNSSRDWFANEFDPLPSWRPSSNGRPHRVVGTGVYQLPFGRKRPFLKDGIPSRIFGGFQLAFTFQWQQGSMLSWGNLFFYGNIDDIGTGERTLNRWFNTDAGFEKNPNKGPASYHRRVFPNQIEGLRRDGTNVWNGNLQRDFRLTERFVMTIRADALNLQNRSMFNAPDMSPTSTNFGRITSQTAAVNRFYQFQARLRF